MKDRRHCEERSDEAVRSPKADPDLETDCFVAFWLVPLMASKTS